MFDGRRKLSTLFSPGVSHPGKILHVQPVGQTTEVVVELVTFSSSVGCYAYPKSKGLYLLASILLLVSGW
jgi:hypothetical protein